MLVVFSTLISSGELCSSGLFLYLNLLICSGALTTTKLFNITYLSYASVQVLWQLPNYSILLICPMPLFRSFDHYQTIQYYLSVLCLCSGALTTTKLFNITYLSYASVQVLWQLPNYSILLICPMPLFRCFDSYQTIQYYLSVLYLCPCALTTTKLFNITYLSYASVQVLWQLPNYSILLICPMPLFRCFDNYQTIQYYLSVLCLCSGALTTTKIFNIIYLYRCVDNYQTIQYYLSVLCLCSGALTTTKLFNITYLSYASVQVLWQLPNYSILLICPMPLFRCFDNYQTIQYYLSVLYLCPCALTTAKLFNITYLSYTSVHVLWQLPNFSILFICTGALTTTKLFNITYLSYTSVHVLWQLPNYSILLIRPMPLFRSFDSYQSIQYLTFLYVSLYLIMYS